MPIEVHTPDNLQYQFYPTSGGCFSFKVRASNDAHLALTTGPAESDPMTEIFIGGWNNTKSVIRKNRQKPDVVEVETPQILSPGEYRGFWIRWYQGVITVGREGEAAAFMSHQDPYLHPINYVGVCTGWGATGSWIIDDPERLVEGFKPDTDAFGWFLLGDGHNPEGCWVATRGGQRPLEAVEGGFDHEPLYLARCRYEKEIVPGKLHARYKLSYIPFDGVERELEEYEILCHTTGSWVPASAGNVPLHAVQAGRTKTGEPLYIGRARHHGTLTPGKVVPSRGRILISYGGNEIPYDNYEVFVAN